MDAFYVHQFDTMRVGPCRYCYQGETNVLMGWQWISGVLAVQYLKWQMASPRGVGYKG